MRTLSTTLTNHARERLGERTKLSEDALLAALRSGKTIPVGLNPRGSLELRMLYSVADQGYFVLPLDIARDRVCTVLPLEMYKAQRRAFVIHPHHLFDAKAKFVEPLDTIHPISGQAIRVHAIGYILSEAGQIRAVNLGHHVCPPGLSSIIEMANDPAFIGGLLDRLREKGLNPARLDSIYVRQGMREPVQLPGVGPANPWAPVTLSEILTDVG